MIIIYELEYDCHTTKLRKANHTPQLHSKKYYDAMLNHTNTEEKSTSSQDFALPTQAGAKKSIIDTPATYKPWRI